MEDSPSDIAHPRPAPPAHLLCRPGARPRRARTRAPARTPFGDPWCVPNPDLLPAVPIDLDNPRPFRTQQSSLEGCGRLRAATGRNGGTFYAGAYVYGKSGTRTGVVDGRLRKRYGLTKPLEEWEVVIEDHHPGFIDWKEFERNRKQLMANNFASGEGVKSGRGGSALLVGMLSCARCGHRLTVSYGSRISKTRGCLMRASGAGVRVGSPKTSNSQCLQRVRAIADQADKHDTETFGLQGGENPRVATGADTRNPQLQ